MRTERLVGKKFGSLEVLQYAPHQGFESKNIKPKYEKWTCLCECGQKVRVTSTNLEGGHVTQCHKCLNPKQKYRRPRKDISGKVNGMLKAVSLLEHPEVGRGGHVYNVWVCECECGTTISACPKELNHEYGKTSCGCQKLISGNMTGTKKVRRKDAFGYIRVSCKGHPRSNKQGAVLEHLIVMEEVIGRPVKLSETVHHKNGIRDDNRPENLELWDKQHPPGQRVEDKVEFYVKWLEEHGHKVHKTKQISDRELASHRPLVVL